MTITTTTTTTTEQLDITTAFARQVAARPAAVAVSAADQELTYTQLDTRAEALAARLRRHGVRAGDVVGVWAPRGADTIVMLLAVLRADAAYLALDHRQPAQRRELILRDAGVTVVLTTTSWAGELPDTVAAIAVDPDQPEPTAASTATPTATPHRVAAPDWPAYVAYTSGSTGRPKGVRVPHRAVTRLVLETDFLPVRADDVFLQFAPIAFDAATLEIWGPLLNGARLVVAPEQDTTPSELARLAGRSGVTVLWLTAGLFHQLGPADLAELRGLRYLLAGGDVLAPGQVERAARALPDTTLVNGYGPTENTTFTCCWSLRGDPGHADAPTRPTVPIGRAIRGTEVHVLDAALRPVAPGEPGELYAGGLGLADGYLNSPALTAARFVPDPFAGRPGARLYRTGDLVRESPAGDLLFLGRVDQQVKVRGFRLEPGEVEAALAALPGVTAAAVVTRREPAGGTGLVGYAAGVGLSALDIRRALGRALPSYAVPALIRIVDALPLTANGKVDRAALAARPAGERPEVHADYRVAASPLEQAVIELWADHLGIVGIGADDDFFELGGNSLLAVSLVEQLRAGYAVPLGPLEFYLDPSPAGLARTITAAEEQRG